MGPGSALKDRSGPSPLVEESAGEHRARDLVGRGGPEGSAHPVEDEQPRGGDRVGERLAVPTGKNGSARPCTTSVGTVSSLRRSRHRGAQLSRANTVPS